MKGLGSPLEAQREFSPKEGRVGARVRGYTIKEGGGLSQRKPRRMMALWG